MEIKDKSAGKGPARALTPFHIAFPVSDLAAAREFYGGVMGCREGRSTADWVDFDLFGHQIVAHLQPEMPTPAVAGSSSVDQLRVPIPHFGVVLTLPEFHALARRLTQAGVRFLVEPTVRFEGQAGEQATMFLLDPAGNALEFKAFADMAGLFAA